jgi:hypothetical protein
MDTNLAKVICNSSLWGIKRNPVSEFDFGDQATVGLRVKRCGKNSENFVNHDFGIYLGESEGKYHVGTCEIMSFLPSKLESFSTLEELKQQWMLD